MTALAAVPAARIVRAIAHAAERWSDADFPERVRASERIAQRTGYSMPVVDYALDRLFFPLGERELRATIERELGSLDTLDSFQPNSTGLESWARPVGSVCVISSRTTIGVALVPAIFALCAKCEVAVKDREDALTASFFESLAEELDEFEAAARASGWRSEDENAPGLSTFDAVVAFGSDATLANISRALAAGARFIGYGSRASAGYVTRESMTPEAIRSTIAPGAARDLVLYESEGCLSLHVLFVERAGAVAPEVFARELAHAVELANVEFPIGRRDASQSARVAHRRDLAAFRAVSGEGCVFANESAEFAVIFDPPVSQAPDFLPRTLGIIPVDGPGEALAYLREHRVRLEGFALTAPRQDAADMAVAAGAVRLTRLGELQHPPLGGHHGGRPRIAEFVRWIDKTT